MNDWILQTEQLTKQIDGRRVVNNVGLRLRKGDIYGFLGPNGAGKTTTIKMLLGLVKPTKGTIRMFGKELRKEKLAVLRNVGSLVEYPSYYGHLNAIENLETVRRILDVPRARIDEVLSIVRLSGEARRAVKGYSLGMKQRLGIATALLGNPELLILDEPTNGLDPSGILEIRELIKKLPREHGITILVSSHLLSEIDQMATEVGIISKGSLIFQDSIAALRQKSKSSIRIGVSEPEKAWKRLLANGIRSDLEEERIVVGHAPNDQIAAIVSLLAGEGFSVYRVEEASRSLEDIFLELTGGETSL
ncbi:ABC transporter ATP-binding protein [Paenibacillus sp. GYB003]|uniref:ABC transporter ATP-binding protein n=1 Tax=Paenibacillus sp. GYB003 TaxID=2994392 RepID=UPI002F96DA24